MRFYLDGLLSKWGFCDGDILEDLVFDNNIDCDEHELLIKVIKGKVIPEVKDNIVLYTIGTNHNPIRATEVNGVTVNWYGKNNIEFSQEFVDVDDKDIIDIARQVT